MRSNVTRHAECFLVSNTHSIVNVWQAELKIVRKAVEANAFHDRIDLVSSPGTFCFGRTVQHAVFDAVVHARAQGIRRNDQRLLIAVLFARSPLNIGRDARQGAPGAGTRHERIEVAARLLPNFGSSVVVMRPEIRLGLELVREKGPCIGLIVVRLPRQSTRTRFVDKLGKQSRRT